MMWQDKNSGLRKHKLMTKALAAKIPVFGTTADHDGDSDDLMAHAKLFCIWNGWSWYIIELDADTGYCYGWVDGDFPEFGYFHLEELAGTTVLGGVPSVERDKWWKPLTIGEIKGEKIVQ